jgi:uncharacterized protein (DUF1684 family)
MKRSSLVILFGASASLVLTSACEPEPPRAPIDVEEHVTDIEAWHEWRIEGLERPDGWLSLVGLLYLEPGAQTFGVAESNPIRFPEVAGYGNIGTFTVNDSTVTMSIASGVPVTYMGDPVSNMTLDVERAEFPENEIRLGTLRWHLLRRNGRFAIRLKDTLSAELVAFEGIDRFPIDTGWHRPARFETYDPPKPITIPNYGGYSNESTSPGAVVFDIDGETYRIDVTGQPGDSAFFMAFGDKSNGIDSYGGGRFIWIDGPDENGRTVIDFNRSYNPPCVFSGYATCPLPPRQNRLPVTIPAGEKQFHAVSH